MNDTQNSETVNRTFALNVQEQLVLQDRERTLSMIDGARDSLDSRAGTLLQTSGILLVLVTLVSLPDFLGEATWPARLALGLAFLAFAAMIGLALYIMMPGDYYTPGTSNWQKLHEDYLMASPVDCYDRILSNLIEAANLLEATNKRKARLLRTSGGLFIAQILCLFVVALFAN